MSEQSLLAVVVPIGTPSLLNVFVARVGNLLSMIGLPNRRIEREIEHFRDARAGKTASKRVLGVMNDLAYHVQSALDRATPSAKVSLSDLELDLASMPQATIGFRTPRELALELMESPAHHGAV